MILSGAQDAQGMVREFHAKYGYNTSHTYATAVAPVPALIEPYETIFRIRLMSEELSELIAAMEKRLIVPIADAIADLAYVVIGTSDYYGIKLGPVFAEVHRSNMTKEYSTQFGKPVKGLRFSFPRIEEILREQGAVL